MSGTASQGAEGNFSSEEQGQILNQKMKNASG